MRRKPCDRRDHAGQFVLVSAILLGSHVALAEEVAPPRLIALEVGAIVEPLADHFCMLRGDPAFQLTAGGVLHLLESGVGARADLAYGDCAHPTTVALVGVGAFPKGTATAQIALDHGAAKIEGPDLLHHPIWWRAGDSGKLTEAACPMVALANGVESCTATIPATGLGAALSRGLAGLTLLRVPAAMPPPDQAFVVWNKHGVEVPLDSFRVQVLRYLLDNPPVHGAPVEGWRAETTLPVGWSGAVTTVTCHPGACRLSEDGTQIIVAPPPEGLVIRADLTLRDGVWLETAQGLRSQVEVTLPVVRCRLRALVPALLGGTDDHRLPLELDTSCPTETSNLITETVPSTGSSLVTQSSNGRHLLVSLGHVPRGVAELQVRLLTAEQRVPVASVTVPVTEGHVGTRAQLSDPELGDVDTIPTNRRVRVQLVVPDRTLAASMVPVPFPGYYSIVAQKPVAEIQGDIATGGTVSIMVGYRPAEANLGPDDPPLVVFPSEPGYQVRAVTVPISLAPEDPRANRFLAVLCRGSNGAETRVVAGQTASLPFESRHSCRLRIDRSALPPENGPQHLRLTIAVTHPDGTAAPGGFSKVLIINRTPGEESIWLEPTIPIHPFDHVHVAMAQEQVANPYAPDAVTGIAGQEEILIFGTERLRLYGSATIPTGLYRVTSGPDGGVVSFSAGALMRLALLNREGREFPIDAEWGLFGTGLAQTGANLSAVAGFGLTVPILNANQPTQASVGIHAWLEYAPTVPGRFVDKLGFIFGPSVSIGDFGTNF